MIKIRDREIEVDVLDELEPYDWYKGRQRGNEFTACSPFRSDSSPSFSINLENGKWIDFGATDEWYKKGGLVTLLSFLRVETPGEVEDYLLDKYSLDLSDIDSFTLDIKLDQVKVEPKIITMDEYKQYSFKHPYLNGRGISDKVQRAFKCGYDKKSNAIALAWTDYKGNIINVKFRSIKSKFFFYYPEGQPIKNHLYGMHFVYKMNCKKVFIVESEIDALYLWSYGYPAVALGHGNINDEQIKLLLRSPIETLVIATDNDSVGKFLREKLVRNTVGFKELQGITFPKDVKDINDLTPGQLKYACENTEYVGIK